MEKISYQKVPVKALRPRTIPRLHQLTRGSGGLMSERLTQCMQKRVGITYIAMNEDDRIIGWSLISKLSTGKVWVNVYVDEDYRRQGIGHTLAEYSKRHRKAVCGSHWNTNIYPKLSYGEITWGEVAHEVRPL